jgi:hypothetical protein
MPGDSFVYTLKPDTQLGEPASHGPGDFRAGRPVISGAVREVELVERELRREWL